MKQVNRSVLLWYSAPEMYALVTGVEQYPQFLPWCAHTEVLSHDEAGMTARMHLAYGGVRQTFTTRNLHQPDREVAITLVNGPFSLLEGVWRFTPLTAPGSDTEDACRIDFDTRYAFTRGALETLVSPVFDRIANTFVDSFVRRAEQVYGPR